MKRKTNIQFKIVSIMCLLFIAGILFIMAKPVRAHATTIDDAREILTDATNKDATIGLDDILPDADDVQGSTFSITYDNGNGEINGALRIMLILTLISFLPAMLIMVTSFTRIIIVMHFVRTALGTQTAPPNQVLIGISVFLTLFIMGPIFVDINENAIKPFEAGEITQEEAFEIGMEPLREFMYGQTQSKDVSMFMEVAGYDDWDGTAASVPTTVLIPSFIISELRTSFIIGFLIYIPFIVIDMVVSSVLMSMGMMMLPPTTISMPFKILLFVLADGWNLVIVNLVRSFY